MFSLPPHAIGLIWAQSRDGVIGRDGGMPWHAPEDMAHFKATTMGHPVIMGRRTWDSIPPRFRPFEGRTTIVLTQDAEAATAIDREWALVAPDLDAALFLARDAEGSDIIWIVGGGTVYAQAAPRADLASVTVFDLDVPDGDTHAPALPAGMELISAVPAEDAFAASERGPAYRFETWVRTA